MFDFYVKTRIRFSLPDKRLFEISEVEITRVDCTVNPVKYSRAPDRWGTEDNSKIILLILKEEISCDPSLEPSRRDSSNDWSQYIFSLRNIDNFP